MKKFHCRDLVLNYEPDDILDFPKEFELEFDNKEVLVVRRKMTWASLFAWKIFREFPDVPILPDHHIQVILDGKMLQSSTHNKCATAIFKTIVAGGKYISPEDREKLQRLVFVYANEFYTGLRKYSGTHLQTIDIVDCVKVVTDPSIQEAWVNVEASPRGVDKMNKAVHEAIYKGENLRNNGLAKALRSGSVKANQVYQSVGVRGYPKEIDGRIYREMVKSNYVVGLVNLYEFVADSRGSAEHLMATESPLQDSEYFSRRLQLQACVLERIAYTDCGTSRTIPWFVKPASFNESSGDHYPGDLKFLIGKNYICKNTGKLLTVTAADKHLIATTIQMRSPMTCNHHDPHSVCQVCLGMLSNNHSRWANLGVVAATTVVSKISQKTLSTKHNIASGQGSGIVFDEFLQKYFRRGPKNTDYVMEKDTGTWNLKLIIPRDGALGLIDIENSKQDIDKINPERITGFTEIRFVGKDPYKKVEFSDILKLSQGNRLASMSLALLKHIQKHGWEMDNRDNFVIDMAGWNVEDVAFTLPDIQVSFSAHGNAIAEVIESKFGQMNERNSEDAPLRVLNQVFDMVTSKLDVNIAALECLIYALQIPRPGSYALSRGAENPVMGIGKDLILNRSMGTACAYQEWKNNILNPISYVATGKPSTMMDVFLNPKEVVAEWNAKHRPARYRRNRQHA